MARVLTAVAAGAFAVLSGATPRRRSAGSDRQSPRHIAYLGGITVTNIAHEKPAHRIYFWNGVEQKLAVLNFSAKERTTIMQVIAKRVPRVSSRQYQQHARVSAKPTVSIGAKPRLTGAK